MMLEKKVNEKTCVRKIQVMTNQYIDLETMENCINCSGDGKYCELYKPIGRTQIRYAYLNLYVQNDK